MITTKEDLRKELIKILDNAIVPYKLWGNRDTPSAQEGCAKKRMYLRAGCDFKLIKDYDDKSEILPKDAEEFIKKEAGIMYLSIFHYEFEDEGSWDSGYFPSPNTIEFHKKNKSDWD